MHPTTNHNAYYQQQQQQYTPISNQQQGYSQMNNQYNGPLNIAYVSYISIILIHINLLC